MHSALLLLSQGKLRSVPAIEVLKGNVLCMLIRQLIIGLRTPCGRSMSPPNPPAAEAWRTPVFLTVRVLAAVNLMYLVRLLVRASIGDQELVLVAVGGCSRSILEPFLQAMPLLSNVVNTIILKN